MFISCICVCACTCGCNRECTGKVLVHLWLGLLALVWSLCVCVSYQYGWWRQLVGPRLPFHPKDHTEKDGGREESSKETGRNGEGERERRYRRMVEARVRWKVSFQWYNICEEKEKSKGSRWEIEEWKLFWVVLSMEAEASCTCRAVLLSPLSDLNIDPRLLRAF